MQPLSSQNDAATLRDNVSGIIKKLEANQSSALASVSILAQVDRVRSRMETAVTTLRVCGVNPCST